MMAAGLMEKLPRLTSGKRFAVRRTRLAVRSAPASTLKAGLAMLMLLGPRVASPASEASTPSRYLVDVWQGERGLPQNTVTGIARTPDGYLWLSTLDGLARFDGVNFKMFKAGNIPALGSGRIRSLFAGRQGTLRISPPASEVGEVHGGKTKLEETVLPCGVAAGLDPCSCSPTISSSPRPRTAGAWTTWAKA